MSKIFQSRTAEAVGGETPAPPDGHLKAGEGQRHGHPRRPCWLLLPCAGLVALFVFGDSWQPWQRLAGATFGMLWLIKFAAFAREPRSGFSMAGGLIFFTCWPGVDPSAFSRRMASGCRGASAKRRGRATIDGSDSTGAGAMDVHPARPVSVQNDSIAKSDAGAALHRSASTLAYGGARLLVRGFAVMMLGFAMIFVVGLAASGPGLWLGWAGIASLLVTIHFGFSDVLTGVMRAGGWSVRLLFDHPFRSRSLGDFWGRRWNLAFADMGRLLFLPPLRRVLGVEGAILGVFVISGVLHDMAISYPVQTGWGMPTVYFVLQGVLVIFESRVLRPQRWNPIASAAWTSFWILAPLPLLFHSPFREGLIVPLFQNLHGLVIP